jgi:hypothetical protein
LKAWQINRRVNRLSEQLADPIHTQIKIDVNSFSEAEKLLFRKVDEIAEKYRETGSIGVLVENLDLVSKNLEVFLMRVRELYCYSVLMVLGCDETNEVVEYFFRLHFTSFEADLTDCLAQVGAWSEKERGEFLLDLRKNGPILFRIPRGFGDYDGKEFSDLNNLKDLEKGVVDGE